MSITGPSQALAAPRSPRAESRPGNHELCFSNPAQPAHALMDAGSADDLAFDRCVTPNHVAVPSPALGGPGTPTASCRGTRQAGWLATGATTRQESRCALISKAW